MKRFLLSIGLLVALTGVSWAAPGPDAKIKVLVITGGHGFKAEPFFKIFQDNPEITYTTANHGQSPSTPNRTAEAYERDDLLSYDVIVLYDAASVITDAQKARFLALFDKGIGVVVLHHALLSYPMWPEYERICGGKYVYKAEQLTDGVTSSDYTRAAVDIPVVVVAPEHPVTAGLRDFVLHDELYTNLHLLPGITPLLTTGGAPLAWTRMEKKSRVVVTMVGHGSPAYEDANFRKLVAQSIRWVAGR